MSAVRRSELGYRCFCFRIFCKSIALRYALKAFGLLQALCSSRLH